MKAVKIGLAGRTQYLLFTVEAMFRIEEEFGSSGGLIEAIQPNTRAGFAAACKAAAILAEQGELARRYLGRDPAPVADADEIAATLSPGEIVPLKLAIPAAMSLGYGREIENPDTEIDLGLAELNAQKKNAVTRAHYLYMGTAGGFSKRETLLSTPGEVSDLWELYLQAHGVRRKPADE